MGDFNHHLEDISNTDTKSLLEAMESLGLLPILQVPTYLAGHTLDTIFTNIPHTTVDIPWELSWSNHRALNFSFNAPGKGKQPQIRERLQRAMRKVTPATFGSAFRPPLLGREWDGNSALEKWEQAVGNAVDSIAPLKLVKTKAKRLPAPRYSDLLKDEKGRCRGREGKWRKSKDPEDKAAYHQAHRIYLNNCKVARRNSRHAH